MTCHRCGDCCKNQPIPPNIPGDGWLESLPEGLQASIRDWPHDDDDPCIWLDLQTRNCLHYEHRPPICRAYPEDGEPCIFERSRTDGHRALL